MSRVSHLPGRSYGRAGGSLGGSASWAANADVAAVGRGGEVRTGQVLDAVAHRPGGPTVLHDLRIPISGINANIDHALVSGRTVYLIDTKVWRPAFYWTLGGQTRRGLERFRPAEKKTMQLAYNGIAAYLKNQRAVVATPVVVIWPSSRRGTLRTWALSIPGARPMIGPRFERWVAARARSRPADPAVVHALHQLLIPVPSRHARWRAA